MRDRLHAPLEYSPQKGYHYTDPDWRSPSINLSQGELFALTLGARMLECYAGSPYIEELRSAIARLGERMNVTILTGVGASRSLDIKGPN